MTGFRRTRRLTCFYCNGRTSTPNDGSVRRFECPHCDATNYLDKNGEITDPPVSTTSREPAHLRYAAVRPSASSPTYPPKSPLSSEPSSIFCNTCLQNQHLYTASLAQYLPDDPDAPDYAERERAYYGYRKGLERLYPQICATCEPRVRARMEKAAYTAKTDLLRRMIDRTNDGRKTKRAGWLDACSSAGRFLWYVGLLLQVAWHLRTLAELATAYVASAQAPVWVHGGVYISGRMMHLLPSSDHLISWSTAAGFMGVWWNPRFVQSVRGFTKHIVGLRTWYSYQVMTMVVRLVLTRLLRSETPGPNELNTQLGGHLFAMGFSIFIAILGPRSVRVDTTPLFKSRTRTVPQAEPTREKDDAQGTKTMSQLLDEMLQAPTSAGSPQCSYADGPFSRTSLGQDSTSFPRQATRANADHGEADLKLRSLNISGEAPATSSAVQYDEEMDWSPTQSQHRAFATHGQRRTTAFGDAPTEPKSGPFWYRVPPAPTTPAQRLRNPPNQPLLRKNPAPAENGIAFGGSRAEGRQEKGMSVFGQRLPADGSQGSQVAFAEPSFFPQPAQNDPRNSLLDLFGESFSLSAEEQERRHQGWFGGRSLFGLVSGKKK